MTPRQVLGHAAGDLGTLHALIAAISNHHLTINNTQVRIDTPRRPDPLVTDDVGDVAVVQAHDHGQSVCVLADGETLRYLAEANTRLGTGLLAVAWPDGSERSIDCWVSLPESNGSMTSTVRNVWQQLLAHEGH